MPQTLPCVNFWDKINIICAIIAIILLIVKWFWLFAIRSYRQYLKAEILIFWSAFIGWSKRTLLSQSKHKRDSALLNIQGSILEHCRHKYQLVRERKVIYRVDNVPMNLSHFTPLRYVTIKLSKWEAWKTAEWPPEIEDFIKAWEERVLRTQLPVA